MAIDVRALRGKNVIALMRPLSLQGTEAAGRLAFQTTHDVSSSRGSDTTQTKDGNIVSLGDEEISISLSSIMAQEDEVRVKLKAAYRSGEIVEFWIINKTEAMPMGTEGAGKFPATYYQGYITDWSESAATDGSVEISLTASINGSGVDGYATLTEDQMIVVQYNFVDTTKQG